MKKKRFRVKNPPLFKNLESKDAKGFLDETGVREMTDEAVESAKKWVEYNKS